MIECVSECDECEGGQAEEEDGADTELKTKTPHVNVGKNAMPSTEKIIVFQSGFLWHLVGTGQ